MKSFSLLSLSIFLFCVACKKSGTEPEAEPQPQPEIPALVLNSTSFDINSEGGDATLSIKGNYPWKITITNQPDWLTISQLEGTGDKDIKLTTTLHQGIDARSVSLKLSSSHEKIDDQTITLTQQSQLNWYKHLKNNSAEYSKSVIRDTDGGLIILSNTSNMTISSRMWVTKLSADGKTTVWAKQIGNGLGSSIIKTSGGFIIGGRRYNELSPMYFTKLSADGSTLEWQYTIGTEGIDHDIKALAATDGGFIVAATLSETEHDVYIAKISENGQAIVWDKIINKAPIESPCSIIPTDDGFVIGAVGFEYDHFTYLTKISPDGQTQLWEKSFHQIKLTDIKSMVPTEGGYVLMGTESNGNTKIAKIATNGQDILWEKSIANEENEPVAAMILTENGYILASHKLEPHNPTKFSLSKLSSDGQSIQWKKTVNSVMRVSTLVNTDTGFVLAGEGNDRGNPTSYICEFRK